MTINYKITEYFEKNDLFDESESNGLKVRKDSNNTLIFEGNSRDLVEFADLLFSLALEKEKGAHIHIDNNSLLDKDSDFDEIIIDKVKQ